MMRNKFSLSNYKLLSCNMGQLVPIGLREVLPGDTFQHSTSALIRVAPLVAPVMHPVQVRIHHWFVPMRLIWEDWEDFITGGPDGLNASVVPFRTAGGGGFSEGGLLDYLGVPTGIASISACMLPARAYQLIFNEWYRDQDLTTEATIELTDGADNTTSAAVQNIAWEKDYFTTARPWTQKGAAVTVPLGQFAGVVASGTSPTFTGDGQTNSKLQSNAAGSRVLGVTGNFTAGAQDLIFGSDTGLVTDLSTATAQSINALREAFALQRYEEARARYGSRFTEYLRYLGVRSSDARLKRPEYLGGGKQTIQFSEVLQTGVTTSGSTDGVGTLRGHGIAALRSNRYRRFFEEHGYVLSLLSVRPKTIYSQGIPKMFSRQTKEDFWQKELEHIGQQEIYNREVYAAHATPDGVFGYQDRYDEYRRAESNIAGEFRSTLDFWHMAREFTSDPSLNSTFVVSNPTDRIYQSTSTDQLWIMAHHSIQARRLVSQNATPRLY